MAIQLNTYIVLAIVIVLLLVLIFSRTTPYITLDGVWSADADFCKQAGISEMTLVIAKPSGGKNNAYLYASADGVVIESRRLVLDLSKNVNFESNVSTYNMRINDSEGLLPEKSTLELNHAKGVITIYDSKQIYAQLFKDFISTEYLDMV